MIRSTPSERRLLAPPPDFRYVGLDPGPRVRVGLVAAMVGASATMGATAIWGLHSREAVLTLAATTLATMALGRAGGPVVARGDAERCDRSTQGVPMAIVPWGVLVEPAEGPRVLRWPAIERVRVDMIHGKGDMTPKTLWSVVTIETSRERFAARAHGAVQLERLMAHVDAYAREQAHVVALDLNGESPGEGPLEPEFEPLLSAARDYLASGPASTRLGLPPGSYRTSGACAPSERAIEELSGVLRDRTDKPVDPRAFAAVLAAELRAAPLADDLLPLIQSPHPFLAAVAKVAARKLGVRAVRAGALDEVAPFLMREDLAALTAWGGAV